VLVARHIPGQPESNPRDDGEQQSELLQSAAPFQSEQYRVPASDFSPNLNIPINDFSDIDGRVDEHNLFLDDLDFFSYLFPDSAGLNLTMPNYTQTAELFSHYGGRLSGSDIRPAPPPDDAEENRATLSRFGSPLPSLTSQKRTDRRFESRSGNGHHYHPPWKISAIDYRHIKANLAACSYPFPDTFVLPSRHSLSRFLEGCMKGMQEHLPFLHIPTFCAIQAAPELLLAMTAIGAQFRFELPIGLHLFYAAKAAILYQVSNLNYDNGDAHPLTAAPDHLSEMSPVPPSPRFSSAAALPIERHNSSDQGINEPRAECVGIRDRALQLMQAILCLLVMSCWGPKKLVRETLVFQSSLSTLAREDCLSTYADVEQHDLTSSIPTQHIENCWKEWITVESHRRIKLMGYTFLNLQCIAYNIPPLILTSEMDCLLPSSAKEWGADSGQQWHQIHTSSYLSKRSFQQSYQGLFQDASLASANPPASAVENYALITAILQRIFFIRQGCCGSNQENNLPQSALGEISRALHTWQIQWERSPESAIEPQSPTGPVSFNSTALLRIAWIRLYVDLGPCRNLWSRDPYLIASAFRESPPLKRSPALTQPVLQAAHALSVPVRMGITYVAKMQTIFWSVQHSLSNLECAIFLSKWFQALALAANDEPLTIEEKALISMIRSMILESGCFLDESFSSSTDDGSLQRSVQRLASAVALLWAEIFKGAHIFDLVTIIGASLNIYAQSLESAHSPLKRAL
jgi:hypothetical protein